MMSKIFKSFAVIIFLCTTCNLYSIDVDPSRIEITLPAGSEHKLNLKLANKTPDISIISVKAGEYRFLLSENSIAPENKKLADTINSCESWISAQLTNLVINPASEKDCFVTIKVPENAKGEYAACIIFDQASPVEKSEAESENEANNEGNMSFDLNLIYRRSIPVYVFIEGTTKIQGEISKVNLEEIPLKDTFYSDTNTIKINTSLKNTGSRHIRLKGNAVILDNQGNILKTLSTGKTLPIFPGFSEIIPIFWSGYPKKSAQYTAVITLDLGDDIIVQKEVNFAITEKGGLVQ